MTTIGSAFIRVLADTAKFGPEVDKEAEKAGSESGSKFSEKFGDKLKGITSSLTGGLAGAGALGGAAFYSAFQQKNSAGELQAKLGLSPAQAKDMAHIAGSVYAKGWGDSLDDVNEAVVTVRQGLTGLGHINLKDVTTQALAFKQTFGVETQESITAVAQMLRTGVAKNAKEAFDILTTGEQNGADKAGDLMDTFNEYGVQFQKLGIQGPQALGLITQAMQHGARNSDLAADALKEFSIRAVDGSKTTARGFQQIGLNAHDMAEMIGKGGKSANRGLQMVLDGLRGIQDPAKRSRAAVNLFGTQAEDLGKALYAMNPATASAAKGMANLHGSADRMQKSIKSTANPLQSLQRSIMGVVSGLASHLVPIIGPASNLIKNMAPEVLGLVAAYVAVTGATKAWQVAEKIGLVLRGEATAETASQTAALLVQKAAVFAVSAATKAWTVVQAAFNVVMDANPVMLLVTAIAALVGGVILAYNKFKWFRDLVKTVWNAIKTGAMVVVRVFTKDIPAAFKAAISWVKSLPGKFAAAGKKLWTWILDYYKLEWKIVVTLIRDAIGFVKSIPGRFAAAGHAVWHWLVSIWRDVWGTVRGLWGNAVGFVRSIPGRIAGAGRAIWRWVTDEWHNMWSNVRGLWGNIVGFVRGLPGRIGRAARGMWDGIKDAFRGAIDWIIRGWNSIQFTIPGFGIGPIHFGGFTLGVPDIPLLARGGVTSGPLIAGIGDNPSGHEAIVPMDDPRTVDMFSDVFDKVSRGSDSGSASPAGYEQVTKDVRSLVQALSAYADRDVVIMLDGQEIARSTMGHANALGSV